MRRHWSESGQGLIEYALTLVLIAVVVIVVIALIGNGVFNKVAPHPPAMNAPLLEIVRWCESNARESYTVPTRTYNAQTKKWEDKLETRWRDAPDKFLSCMQTYEYTVKR